MDSVIDSQSRPEANIYINIIQVATVNLFVLFAVIFLIWIIFIFDPDEEIESKNILSCFCFVYSDFVASGIHLGL